MQLRSLVATVLLSATAWGQEVPPVVERMIPEDGPKIKSLFETAPYLRWEEVLKALPLTDLYGYEGESMETALYSPGAEGRPSIFVNSAAYNLNQEATRLSDFNNFMDRPLFEALVEARLQLEVSGLLKSTVGDFIRERAPITMKNVVPESQVEGFISALVAFSSDLLTIINQIEGMKLRKLAQGKGLEGLCGLIEKAEQENPKPLTLFVAWNNLLTKAPHFGAISDPKTGEVYFTRDVLSEDDKREAIRLLFGDHWRGSSRVDFGPDLCGNPQ